MFPLPWRSTCYGGLAGMRPWGTGSGDFSNCRAPGLGLSPRMPGLLPLPVPAHFQWHYHACMREHRVPQRPLSQGNRKLTTSGHLGCLCSEAVNKAERAGRRRLLDSYVGICRHRDGGGWVEWGRWEGRFSTQRQSRWAS